MVADRILQTLLDLAQQHPEFRLLQFRTLISARQYKHLYELIAKFIPPGSKVLDWGCGNGHTSYALNNMGYIVAGHALDDAPSLGALLPTVKFYGGQSSNPRVLPFKDQSFDAVLSVGVLEHVRESGGDELASMREIQRILRPGGIFLCYHLPNRYSYLEALSRLIPRAHSHIYRFTKSDILNLCTQAGLDIALIDRYGFLPRNPWQSAPIGLGNSKVIAKLWDCLDTFGTRAVPAITQNYRFVATRS